MTAETQRGLIGRQPIRLMELHLDECNLTYGVSPCTASQGDKCYLTKNTCHDPVNYLAREKGTATAGTSTTITLSSGSATANDAYNGMIIEIIAGTGKGESGTITDYVGSTLVATVTFTTTPDSTSKYLVSNTKVYRHVIPISNLPAGAGSIPDIKSINIHPTMLDESGFSKRGTVTVDLQDAPHHDRGTDPHASERASQANPYTASEQGTYWGKLKARNLYYQDRLMRIRDGYLVSGMSFADGSTDFVDRDYLIDRIEGEGGSVRVIGKDILNLTRDKKAKAPMLSTGKLTIAYTSGGGSLTLTTGTGSDYSSGDYVIGDKEIFLVDSVSGDVLTVTGEQKGTTAANHSIDVLIQKCYVANGNVVDVLESLLEDFTDINPKYIPSTDWATEKADWLASYDIDGLKTKPTGVDKIIREICIQTGIYMHFDEVAKEIVISAFKPPQDAVTITDYKNIIADSADFKDEADKRASTCIVYYNKQDHSESDSEESNYSELIAYTDTDRETADGFGKPAYKVIKANWLQTGAVASAVAGRTVRLLSGMPISCTLEVDVKDDIKTGQQIKVESYKNQSITGSTETTTFLVQKVRDGMTTRKLTLIQSAFLDERYCYVLAAQDTTVSGAHNDSITTITVASTTGFSTTGRVIINSEEITYTGVTSTTFTGCARGSLSTATAHSDTDAVWQKLRYDDATDAQKDAQPGAGWICDSTGFFADGKPAYKVI